MGAVLKKRKRMKSLAHNLYTAQIITLLGDTTDNIGIIISDRLYDKILALEVKFNDYYWYGWDGDNGF